MRTKATSSTMNDCAMGDWPRRYFREKTAATAYEITAAMTASSPQRLLTGS